MRDARLSELAQIGQLRLEKLRVVRPPSGDAVLPPTEAVEVSDERRQHDPVRRDRDQVTDSDGRIGRPYRVVDTLMLMERRGSITAAMRAAGETFREDFALGQLDALKAADLARAGIGTGSGPYAGVSIGHRAELARSRVWLSIRRCGGIASPGGSCVWHVLGWGQSLSEWGKVQGWAGRSVSPHGASAILITALGVLAEKSP